MRTIARFVTRRNGKKANGCLLLGLSFGHIEENRVYEIREIMDELCVIDLGPSAIGSCRKTSSLAHTNWDCTIDQILTYKEPWILTKDEYTMLCNNRNPAGNAPCFLFRRGLKL
jgi:hypothetical protein